MRARLERGFGADLGGVRVHEGSIAAASADSLGARAFAVGPHVVLGERAPSARSEAGVRLLGHEVAHVLQQSRGGGGRVIHRQVADSLNYANLAERIHTAIEGLGTDEEAVYLALQQCQGDATAISRLEGEYLRRYNVTLEADIRDDFSGEELEYALQLMNRGAAGSAQAVGSLPSGSAEMDAAAGRLRSAVEGFGTDEEAIYATLLPFNRDMRALRELMDAYERLYSENLRERIIDEMSGSELDYALYLLGGAAIRAQPEITEVTEVQAAQLFQQLAQLTFWTNVDTQAPVPFHYPPDGCYARAHLMAERLTELGYASDKVFAISTAQGGLRVPTDYAGDMPVGQQTTPGVGWWYHVAPVIHVRDAQGNLREMVIDPSLASGPITIDQWTGVMRNEPFTRLTDEQIRQQLESNRNIFPSGQNIVVTSSRDVFYPQDLGRTPTAQDADEEMSGARGTLTSYALYAEVHELAASVRQAMRTMPLDVNLLLTLIAAAPRSRREGLWMIFPNLTSWMLASLTPADRTRVQAALWAP